MPGEGGEVVSQLRPMSAMTLEKFGYMLETPPDPTLLEDSSDKALGDADNQQGSRSVDYTELTPQRLHAELLAATADAARAYLMGACHDATLSQRHGTVRFGQSNVGWLRGLAVLLATLGQKSWLYREGRRRKLWILETSARWSASCTQPTTVEERVAYARGFFDAEGGVPHDAGARFYIHSSRNIGPTLITFARCLRAWTSDVGSYTTRASTWTLGCGASTSWRLHKPHS